MITITRNDQFFKELSQLNPKLARLLEHEHGWTDKLVYRSTDASISQPGGRQEGTAKAGDNPEDQKVAPSTMGRN